MPKTPPKAAPGARIPESKAVMQARTAVNAAAAEFETARQAMADAGEACNTAKAAEVMKINAAFTTAKAAYTAAGATLGRAQQALTAAQTVKK